ncbi:MAG: D-alanyl-D-alanine carboxypeptidase family protein [Oscillospiraceae bacterium]|nr:D-alanyl-D-alanine carboxypeptidase family protein [Oscillospiraceae bacterium]
MIKRIISFIIPVAMIVPVIMPGHVSAAQTDPAVSARGAVLIEAKTGNIIMEKNADTKLPMASTTKIMTTLLCLESGDLDEEFVVDPEAIKVEGSSMGLVEGDLVSKRDLCIGMLLPSGNDAANATAVKLAGSIPEFAKLMNRRAEEIGMTRTCFVTPSGLEGEGHGASAYDMALLAREALRNEDFAAICSQSTARLTFGNPPYDRWLKNTNKLLRMYSGVTGVKTGFTDEAGRCLVSSCERDGVSLICVTLNDRNDWDDHMKMYDYGFSVLHATELRPESVAVNVVGGMAHSIPVMSDGCISIGTKDSDLSMIESRVFLEPFLYAPVASHTYAGYIEYYNNDRLIDSLDLYTSASTGIETGVVKKEATIGRKIIDFFRGIIK